MERNGPFPMLERIDNGFEISYTVGKYVRQKMRLTRKNKNKVR